WPSDLLRTAQSWFFDLSGECKFLLYQNVSGLRVAVGYTGRGLRIPGTALRLPPGEIPVSMVSRESQRGSDCLVLRTDWNANHSQRLQTSRAKAQYCRYCHGRR